MLTLKLRLSAVFIAIVFAIVTIGSWAWLNRPETEPEWPHRVWGFALSPYHPGQDAIKEEYPTREQIAGDLDLLKGKARAVRTYTVSSTIGLVPELAAERGLNVAMGVWIDSRQARAEAKARRCALTFERQFHYAIFYAYMRLREQEIRNLMWVSECVAQDQHSRVQDGIISTF